MVKAHFYGIVVVVSIGAAHQGVEAKKGLKTRKNRTVLNKKLFEAIVQWDEKEAAVLLEKGANPNVRGNGTPPLHRAVALGLSDTVKALVARGADVNATDKLGETALHRAATVIGAEHIATFLLEKGARVSVAGANGNTALHLAIVHKRPRIALKLLEHDADVRMANKRGKTPLHVALTTKMAKRPGLTFEESVIRAQKVKKQQGAEKPVKRQEEQFLYGVTTMPGTILHKVVTGLINHREADLNATDINGQTPLHMAVLNGYLPAVKQLLKHKVKVNPLNRWRKTPLDYAVTLGQHMPANKRIVELLRQRGAWSGMTHR